MENTPDHLFFVSAILTLRRLGGLSLPRHVRTLASGLSPVTVTRRDPRSLEVRLGRGLFAGALARLYRDAGHPLRRGDAIALPGMTITIEEDPTLRWVRWQDGVYVPFTPPATGATVHFVPAIGPFERLAGLRADDAGDAEPRDR